MLPYNKLPIQYLQGDAELASFISHSQNNIHKETVQAFGKEWNKFAQFSSDDIRVAGEQYFDIVDETILNKDSLVLDVGCGSGRWSRFIADRVKHIEAIDPSEAIVTAANNSRNIHNIRWTHAGIDTIPFDDHSFDFVLCLGVLHHIPDTQLALSNIVKKLKQGGHVLLYLYYALDNRGILYKTLFQISSVFRKVIATLPHPIKHFICDAIALFVYFPLVVMARSLKKLFPSNLYKAIPLSYYSDKSFHIMRNDALDRFGTPLEQRFTKSEITAMMEEAGLSNINFSDNEPYWHVVGKKH